MHLWSIRQVLQALVTQMDRIAAPFAKPVDDSPIHVHLGQEAHGILSREELLLRQPGRVLDGLLDVRAL